MDGKQNSQQALTAIKGVGANPVLKKADIDLSKWFVHFFHPESSAISDPSFSAGELAVEELERIVNIIRDPVAFKIATWFLYRQRDIVDGATTHVTSNAVDSKLREDLERLKHIRAHKGLRHY